MYDPSNLLSYSVSIINSRKLESTLSVNEPRLSHFLLAPLTTPFSQMTDMRSSTPLTPLGMRRKSSLPSAFWLALNVQLSVPVTCRSSLKEGKGSKHAGGIHRAFNIGKK